ncbi:TPA: tail fiber assembly protein [Pluralibacter gergoviae]|nr:tail fiber assembly protein [Pluralibacter gergoviae]
MSFEFSQSPQALWIYQYGTDGVYIGSVFMTIPAGTGLPASTTHLPCEPAQGQTGIFTDGQWQYVDDIRGQRYWDEHGTGFVISSLSEALPDWAITSEPPTAEPGHVLQFADGQWLQVEDKTGSAFYESDGTKHIVTSAWFTLPAGCTFVEPPETKPTFVTRWNGTEWVYVKDLRGLTVWNTATKEASTIIELGPVPDGYTRLIPGQFDDWDGTAWVKNLALEAEYLQEQAKARKAELLAEASQQIAVLTYAADSGQATDDEAAMLAKWQDYRLSLSRIDTASADIAWPQKP